MRWKVYIKFVSIHVYKQIALTNDTLVESYSDETSYGRDTKVSFKHTLAHRQRV